MTPRIVVAVVSWNTRDLLRRCLTALEPECGGGEVEVWVVDNGSGDGSPEMVAAEFPWVRLERPDRNLGFGPAVNLVAERTSAPLLVAANADTAVTPGALERLAAAIGDGSAIAAPRLLLPDGSTQQSVHSFPGIGLSLAVILGLGAIPGLGNRLCLDGRWDPDQPREIAWAHGALLMIDRTAFNAIGGFDESQWMYAEDLDLCWRARRAGFAVRYEPAARVEHAVSAATVQAFGDERGERYMRATYGWMLRRRGVAASRAFALVNVAGAWARLALARGLARISGGRLGRDAAIWRSYIPLHRIGLEPRERLTDRHYGQESTLPRD